MTEEEVNFDLTAKKKKKKKKTFDLDGADQVEVCKKRTSFLSLVLALS